MACGVFAGFGCLVGRATTRVRPYGVMVGVEYWGAVKIRVCDVLGVVGG